MTGKISEGLIMGLNWIEKQLHKVDELEARIKKLEVRIESLEKKVGNEGG